MRIITSILLLALVGFALTQDPDYVGERIAARAEAIVGRSRTDYSALQVVHVALFSDKKQRYQWRSLATLGDTVSGASDARPGDIIIKGDFSYGGVVGLRSNIIYSSSKHGQVISLELGKIHEYFSQPIIRRIRQFK